MDFNNSSVIVITIAYLISNAAGLAMLILSWRKSPVARWLYFALFTWAAYTNGKLPCTCPAYT
jgi:hypothetical protein